MNCKPGDLAIVKSGCHSGKILTCIRWQMQQVEMPDGSVRVLEVWETDREFRGCFGTTDRFIEDELLSPIRDPGPDAVDETLRDLEAA